MLCGHSVSLVFFTELLPSQPSLSRSQEYKLTWRPEWEHRSAIPIRLCFRGVLLSEVAVQGQPVYLAAKSPFTVSTAQYSLLEDIKRSEGDLYCVYVLVGKCSHMVQGGETLDRLAKLYRTDWLST